MSVHAERRRRWNCPERNLPAEANLRDALGIESLLASTLVARGLTDPLEAERFLCPSADDLHDPLLLPDANSAVASIMLAKENCETVYVHGDYDVDGVTSAAIWTRSLRKLGFKVVPHVPHRMKEGYGIHEIAVREARDAGASLFLTCDCGSSAHETVAQAKEFGMRVVVTDHHEIADEMPRADAVVNPHRRDSTYPFPFLSGAGVAFKMAQAVAEECGVKASRFHRAFLDLACMGTIADVVPLIGENRVLASLGLKELAATKKPGLKALISAAKLDTGRSLSARDVGWRLGPRLNAAGRIADADQALQLLLTEDPAAASVIASELEQHNDERRKEQVRILEHAEELIREHQFDRHPLMLLAAPDWHAGVIGIVAGRLAAKYFRPVLVASINEETGIAKGSARSIPKFHLHDAFHRNAHLFKAYGGHALAAGFSMSADRIEDARELMVRFAERTLDDEDLVPSSSADARIGMEELDLDSVADLQRMEPYGEANPEPQFLLQKARVTNPKRTPKNPNHAQFEIEDSSVVRGIAFNIGDSLMKRSLPAELDLLIRVNVDEWNGRRRVNVQLQDFR